MEGKRTLRRRHRCCCRSARQHAQRNRRCPGQSQPTRRLGARTARWFAGGCQSATAHPWTICWQSGSASVDYVGRERQRIGGLEYMLAENLVELRHGGRQKGDQHRHAHLQNEG